MRFAAMSFKGPLRDDKSPQAIFREPVKQVARGGATPLRKGVRQRLRIVHNRHLVQPRAVDA
jgi:hypothetical protein